MDLLLRLMAAYFNEVNSLLPLLHQPTFERDVTLGRHLHERPFGNVLLMVCALGARYVVDPRIRNADGVTGMSSGQEWFELAHGVPKSLFTKPSLVDIQLQAVRHVPSLRREPY
jgi:hypothetical protein